MQINWNCPKECESHVFLFILLDITFITICRHNNWFVWSHSTSFAHRALCASRLLLPTRWLANTSYVGVVSRHFCNISCSPHASGFTFDHRMDAEFAVEFSEIVVHVTPSVTVVLHTAKDRRSILCIQFKVGLSRLFVKLFRTVVEYRGDSRCILQKPINQQIGSSTSLFQTYRFSE